jgi:hypothetical protein
MDRITKGMVSKHVKISNNRLRNEKNMSASFKKEKQKTLTLFME